MYTYVALLVFVLLVSLLCYCCCRMPYAYALRVNNIRRECLTPYGPVKYDCVKLKGFPVTSKGTK